jgi:hypothetical protein
MQGPSQIFDLDASIRIQTILQDLGGDGQIQQILPGLFCQKYALPLIHVQ